MYIRRKYVFKFQVSDAENDVKYMHVDHVLVYGEKNSLLLM